MNRTGRLVTALFAAGIATAAYAGGPIYTFDYENRIPYAWNMATWPDGKVPVYTDLGTLGVLSNERASEMVQFAVNQWSSVPTSSFRAEVAGDFSAIGLGDVDYSTIFGVIGYFNGGGIDVVYDNDGSILANFFGLSPIGTLGITNLDFGSPDSPEILEAWMILSGPGIHANDPEGVGFQGVVTHELGHALNLAHAQSNGPALPSDFFGPPQPVGCRAPWAGLPDDTQAETMFPFITPEPGGSGEFMGTVDRLDDQAALSDIYPGLDWPAKNGTIRGQVLDSSGNPVMGINVIARNIADPFGDCTSYISGQVSKGQAGPDGSFVLNGLTPGASYVLYTDWLAFGGFSVPRPAVLPGPEEYWNGPLESGDGSRDDRCAWSQVAVDPGNPVTLKMTFNHIPGAPTFIAANDADFPSIPFDITADGSVVVGAAGFDGPVFRWDVNANTIDLVGGTVAGQCGISDDGQTIAANVVDTDGSLKAAIYQNGTWTALPPVSGAAACDYGDDSPPVYASAYGISGDGSTVVGLSYGARGCDSSTVRAFKWTAAGGTVALPKLDAFSRASRANAVNYDGSVIVGWDDSNNGQRRGAQWRNGALSLIKTNNLSVGEALGVSSDGQHITGLNNSATNHKDWLWSQPSGLQILGGLPTEDSGLTGAVNDDASVITGQALDFNAGTIIPTIWTPELGLIDFDDFLSSQGVITTGLGMRLGMAMSADGSTITGYANGRYGYVGWVLKIPTALVCHTQENASTPETLAVPFPQGLNDHLAHGDTLGSCPCVDADGDGYSTCGVDCDDANPDVHYGASDASCNGIDDDCNGVVDDGASCDDGNPCNGLETCGGAAGCQPGAPIVCAASDPCHDAGVCDPGTGLCSETAKPDGTACDDGNPGTSGDSCQAGVCTGSGCPASPDPRSKGYYKGLCNNAHAGDSLTDADAACVAGLTVTFSGISTVDDICRVLRPGKPNSDFCSKAEDELMVLALNLCKQRVCTAQEIDSRCGGDGTSIGASLAEMDSIFSDANRDRTSCDHGGCLGEEINSGVPMTPGKPRGRDVMGRTAR